MKVKKYLIISALAALSTGCTLSGVSNEFGCSGLPDGVVCKTPTQIYDLTDGDRVGVYADELAQAEQTARNSGMFKESKTKATIKGQAKGAEVQMIDLFSKPQFQANSNPMPILEQPKVLRIWVAPWKDENETLTWGSYLFTEITPRRWNYGDSVMRNTSITAPNHADFKSASETLGEKEAHQARSATDREVDKINKSIANANAPKSAPQEKVPVGIQRQNDLAGDSGNEMF